VLVFLTGGPGQPEVLFATLVASQLLDPAVLRDYRLVLIDQRGTDGGALQCPELQQAMGGSELTVPPTGAVKACAELSESADSSSPPPTRSPTSTSYAGH
jgi:pimeloyl-ACP methyl ester carboxylesterase